MERFFHFGLATAPRVFTALTKPILFLCILEGFHIVIYLDDILVLVHSKQAGKRAHSFSCSLLVCLVLHINFSKSDLWLTQTFCFLGVMLGTVHLQYLCLLISQLTFSSWIFLCCRPNLLQSIGSGPFLARQILCQWPLPIAEIVLCHSE